MKTGTMPVSGMFVCAGNKGQSIAVTAEKGRLRKMIELLLRGKGHAGARRAQL
jgi:hypothetical protein